MDARLNSESVKFTELLGKEFFISLTGGEREKLTKAKLKHFLAQKYGSILAEKLQAVHDFNSGPLDFKMWKDQIEQLIKERNLVLQIAFDIFDTNNDEKISSLDLFKIMHQMTKINGK